MKTICLIQARLGSARLPEKVLADIEGKTMLRRVYDRAAKIKGVDGVYVITSFSEADRRLVDYCQREGIPVMRGGSGEDDVLGRYYDCATQLGAEAIVRVTADCPMLDSEVASDVLALFTSEYDYVSNVLPPTFPDGLDTEVFSYDTLLRLHKTVTCPADREHVTSDIYLRLEQFRTTNLHNEPVLTELRWTVDTPEDLEFVRAIFKELGDDFNMEDVLKLLEQKPELAAINAGHTRNEGLEASKKKDRKK